MQQHAYAHPQNKQQVATTTMHEYMAMAVLWGIGIRRDHSSLPRQRLHRHRHHRRRLHQK